MAINRTSGKMLQDNLLRDGADIAFETNLLYIDVTNNRVGVNTSTPSLALDVLGSAKIDNVTINSNTINALTGDLILNSSSGNITVSDKKITLCADPTLDQDVVNKRFLDNIIAGFNLDKIISNDSELIVIDTGIASSFNYQLDGVSVATMDASLFNLTMPITTSGEISAATAQIGSLNISANTFSSDTGVIDFTSGIKFPGAPSNRVTYVDSNDLLNSSANLKFDGTTLIVVGVSVFDDITIDADTISSLAAMNLTTASNGNLTLTTNAGIIVLDSTAAVLLPSGTTLARPAAPTAGMMRWDTDSGQAEIYDGTTWQIVQRGFDVLSEQFTGDGTTTTFTLSKTATADGILVIINGIVQDPAAGTIYSVIGTALTFTSAPTLTDIISIRFLEF